MRREDRHTYRPDRSPRRQLITSELDEHSNRIKELLRADLNMLEEENAILKAKCKKVGELQSKVEMILRQNSDLLTENQKISKILHETRSEYEIIKNKYETTMAQKLNFSSELQFEKKKLLNEIDHLQNEVHEIEQSRAYQVNELRSQSQQQAQAMKRQIATTQQAYEQQIRKLRQALQKRDYELADCNNRLKRFSSESEYEMIRVKEERQKLRNQIAYLENDHQKQIENLKIKLQTNCMDEIETVKRSFSLNMGNIQSENERLKDYLHNRGYQVQELSTKMGKQKNHFEETISMLRKENQSIRLKMMEDEKYYEKELENLNAKLHHMHGSQVEELKINHQKYIDCLQVQILKLQGFIKNKNEEIEQLIKEKSNVRHLFAGEGNRLKEQIDALNFKIRDLQGIIKSNEQSFGQKLLQKENQIKFLDDLNAMNLQKSRKDIEALEKFISLKENELKQERIANKEREQELKQSNTNNTIEINNLKDEVRRLKAMKEREIEDLKNQYEGKITQLKTKVDTLTTKVKILQKENQSLKSTLQLKEKQIFNLHNRMKNADEREKKLQKQNQELRVKIIKKDQKSNELLAEQKKRLQSSFAYTLDNLKTDNQSALKLQRNKLNHANEKINKKDEEIQQLLKAYKKMREQIQVLTEQEANKKDLTIKFPGATADLLATKNIFDVFLKTKVLDVCGDAKENKN